MALAAGHHLDGVDHHQCHRPPGMPPAMVAVVMVAAIAVITVLQVGTIQVGTMGGTLADMVAQRPRHLLDDTMHHHLLRMEDILHRSVVHHLLHSRLQSIQDLILEGLLPPEDLLPEVVGAVGMVGGDEALHCLTGRLT